jgi:PPOX class probable F420-dependent enzyme
VVAKLTDGQAKVFLEPNLGVVVTLRRNGSAHMTPVWVDAREGDVLFNTAEGRAKPRRLRRDPRVGVVVVDRHDDYRWVSVWGHAELTTEGAEEHIHELSRKYTGHEYRGGGLGQRIIVRVHSDRIESRGT